MNIMVQSTNKKIKSILKSAIKKFVSFLGYKIHFSKKINKKQINIYQRFGKNLNIGCGNYTINGFISLDIYTDHYHRNQKSNFIEYNLRKDNLPFQNNSIDNIYISHVIEHIETKFVEKFIEESYRVLKLGGVLRVACPDAEFLYEVSSFENDYWSWRINWFKGKNADPEKISYEPSQMDFFIREISTPKCEYYINRQSQLEVDINTIKDLSYQQTLEKLTNGLQFRPEYPGDHINAWDFYKLKEIGQCVGFTHIIRSKPGGSVSLEMQGSDMDRTYPEMSLYVDMVK